MSLRKIISEAEYNISDSESFIESLFFHIDYELEGKVDHYISSGSFGDVFKVKNVNKVIKITNSDLEFQIAEAIEGRTFDNIMNIYFTSRVNPSHFKGMDDEVLLIVGEYLEPDNRIDIINEDTDTEKIILETLDDVIDGNNTSSKIPFLEGEIMKDIKEKGVAYRKMDEIRSNLDNDKLYSQFLYNMSVYVRDADETIRLIHMTTDIISDVYNGLKELNELGIKNYDLHFKNILQDPKTDNYKIIDIQ